MHAIESGGTPLCVCVCGCIKRGGRANNMAARFYKTEKPRERTKDLQGIVRTVLLSKNTFTDNYKAP